MRCVHLDFHTSPLIEGIGEKFNKEKFVKTIKDANIDLMTVFAKCHHGYTYYPSKVSTMHPHLKFNLLQEQIDAIHEAGAKAPIKDCDWITLDLSDRTASILRILLARVAKTLTYLTGFSITFASSAMLVLVRIVAQVCHLAYLRTKRLSVMSALLCSRWRVYLGRRSLTPLGKY